MGTATGGPAWPFVVWKTAAVELGRGAELRDRAAGAELGRRLDLGAVARRRARRASCPEESSLAAGSSCARASFSRRSTFQSASSRALSSAKGGRPAARSSEGLTKTMPRGVVIGVAETLPTGGRPGLVGELLVGADARDRRRRARPTRSC